MILLLNSLPRINTTGRGVICDALLIGLNGFTMRRATIKYTFILKPPLKPPGWLTAVNGLKVYCVSHLLVKFSWL